MSLGTRRVLLPVFALLLLLGPLASAGCVFPTGSAPALPVQAPAATSTPSPVASPTLAVTVPPVPVAYSVTPVPVVTPAPTPEPVVFNPTYRWEYKNVRWAFTMVIPEEAYLYFKAKPRTPGMSYADYALADEDRDTLQGVADQIKSYGVEKGYSDYDNAMNVLTFVQSLPYSKDADSEGISEYPRYPIETLKDGTGDCEDKTILAAALLQKMGIDTVILLLPDHSALGVSVPGASGVGYDYAGTTYYYAETTSGNWKIGVQPDELHGLTVRVVPLEKSPVLGLQLTATSVFGSGQSVAFRTEYTVKNAGPGTARGLALKLRVYDPNAGENHLWEPEQTVRLGDLEEGQTNSGEVTLSVPLGEEGQITCDLTGDNVDTRTVRTEAFTAVR